MPIKLRRIAAPRETARRTGLPNQAGSSVLVSPALATSVVIQPIQQCSNAATRQGDRAIRSSVIDIEGVAVGFNRVSTGEHNIVNVSVPFVLCLWAKDPGVSTRQALLWILKIEQGETQSVQTTGGRVPYSVIEHEPSSGSLDRWRRQTNLVGVPPCTSSCFQHEPMPAPITQVGRVGDPHMRAKWRHRAMNQRPIPVNSARQ